MSSVPSNLIPTRITQLPTAPVASEDSLLLIVYQGNNYQIRAGDLLSVAGVPVSRQVIAGTGLSGGGQLLNNVTLSVASKGINGSLLADTGVAAGVYGSSTQVPVFTVDSTGRVTAASSTSLVVSGYVPESREIIAGTGLTGGGTLNNNVTIAADLSDATPQSGFQSGSAGVATSSSRSDHKHPAVDLSSGDEVDNILGLSNGGTAKSIVPDAGAIIWCGADGLYVGPVGVAGQILQSAGVNEYVWVDQDTIDAASANDLNGGAANRIAYQTAPDTTDFIDAPTNPDTLLKWNGTGFEWGSVAGAGTVTQINTGTGLTGGPITSSGTISIDSTVATLTGSQTLTNKTISGANNTLTNIGNSSLSNNSVAFNGVSVPLGGAGTLTANTTNALTIGTGLNGSSFDGSTAVTIALANTAVTAASYGSATYSPSFTVDQQGRITAASQNQITPSGIGAISAVNGTSGQITSSQVGTTVTIAVADAPTLVGPVKVKGANVSSITPFSNSMQAWEADDNSFQIVYARNLNNGSDASADFVAYNDTSDANSYFIDMGMNSSNFTSLDYPIFTPNSAYVFTGGGSSGQQTDLFIGTSNPNSDIIFFTGGVETANERGLINGSTGNFLLGTATDTGYKLNVNGTAYVDGAMTFGSTVTLDANPTMALEAATKQYVDGAVSTGFVVHAAVVAATPNVNLATVYDNGTAGVGATLTADTNRAFTSLDGVAVSLGQRLLIKNQTNAFENGIYTLTTVGVLGVSPWVLTRATDFDTAAAGEIANNAYVYVTGGTTQLGTSWVLAQLAAITVGTTALPFDLFAQPVAYTVDSPLSLVGTTLSLSGTVAATNGGTGTNTVTTGDLLYGSAADTWSKLSLGSAYKSLVINASGTQLEWNAVALNQASAVSGQLGVSNGGTGSSTASGARTNLGLGTIATQDASAVAVTGGTIDGTVIGGSTAAAITGTTITAANYVGMDGGTF